MSPPKFFWLAWKTISRLYTVHIHCFDWIWRRTQLSYQIWPIVKFQLGMCVSIWATVHIYSRQVGNCQTLAIKHSDRLLTRSVVCQVSIFITGTYQFTYINQCQSSGTYFLNILQNLWLFKENTKGGNVCQQQSCQPFKTKSRELRRVCSFGLEMLAASFCKWHFHHLVLKRKNYVISSKYCDVYFNMIHGGSKLV